MTILRRMVLVTIALAFSTPGVSAQVSAMSTSFYEVNADFEDDLQLVQGTRASCPSHPCEDVECSGMDANQIFEWSGGLKVNGTYAVRAGDTCAKWETTQASPYMGSRSYTVACNSATIYGVVCGGIFQQAFISRRSEQMLVSEWCPHDVDSNQRYVSLAFRLSDLPMSTNEGFIAQLHQGPNDDIPFILKWSYLCPPSGCRHFILMATNDNTGQYEELGPPIAGLSGRRGIPADLDVWYNMAFWFHKFGATNCVGGPDCVEQPEPGEIRAWLMSNMTGLWEEIGYQNRPIGVDINYSVVSGTCNMFQWKVGAYKNDDDAIVVDYDNLTYGQHWYHLTKNNLTGYHKNVVRLAFDSTYSSGGLVKVNDESWRWNGGSQNDPYTDYQNDVTLQSGAGLSSAAVGGTGKSLLLNGTSQFASVSAIDQFTESDVGNYITVSAWVRPISLDTTNRGIVMIDDLSTTWKVLLYISNNNVSFGVRHKPGADSSKLNHPVSLPVGQWSNIVGVFNRFASDGNRVKLYINGTKVNQYAGTDLPVLRGESRLTVGKYSSGYFNGRIDEVNIFNYPMTDAEVLSLFQNPGVMPTIQSPGYNVEETLTSFGDDQESVTPDEPDTLPSDEVETLKNGCSVSSNLGIASLALLLALLLLPQRRRCSRC